MCGKCCFVFYCRGGRHNFIHEEDEDEDYDHNTFAYEHVQMHFELLLHTS